MQYSHVFQSPSCGKSEYNTFSLNITVLVLLTQGLQAVLMQNIKFSRCIKIQNPQQSRKLVGLIQIYLFVWYIETIGLVRIVWTVRKRLKHFNYCKQMVMLLYIRASNIILVFFIITHVRVWGKPTNKMLLKEKEEEKTSNNYISSHP